MILRYTNEAGAEWLISAPADTEEEARAMLENPVSPGNPSRIESNGGGPWTYAGIEHEHSFPWDRVEHDPNLDPELLRKQADYLIEQAQAIEHERGQA